jgi:hypothetical protein
MSNEFTVKAIIDLHEMDHDDIADFLEHGFRELSSSEKEDFMRLNLDEAADDDIEEYYLNNIDKGTEEDDSLSPSSLENEQRCLLLADTLSAFACSRLRPTLPEALDLVKQMYNFMGWK